MPSDRCDLSQMRTLKVFFRSAWVACALPCGSQSALETAESLKPLAWLGFFLTIGVHVLLSANRWRTACTMQVGKTLTSLKNNLQTKTRWREELSSRPDPSVECGAGIFAAPGQRTGLSRPFERDRKRLSLADA